MAVDALPAAASRATLLRRLRQLEDRGELRLEWRVLAASARPRQERWAVITADGRAVAALLAAGERPPGPPLGARQQALLLELSAAAHAGAEAAPRLGERHGAGTVTSLARRGLLELETRTLERRALSGRAAPSRGSRPAGSDLDPDQAAALQAVARPSQPATTRPSCSRARRPAARPPSTRRPSQPRWQRGGAR